MANTVTFEDDEIESAVETVASACVLIEMTFGKWGNSKKADVELIDTDANRKRLRLSKRLIECEPYDAIVKYDAATRALVKDLCMPSSFGDSQYVLPIARFETVKDLIDGRKAERRDLVMKFLAVYDKAVEESEAELGSLHNSEDYPDMEVVAGKFTMQYRFRSWETPGTLQAISKDVFEQERRKTQLAMAELLEENRVMVRAGIKDTLDHIIEVLEPGEDGKKKIIRESALGNLKQALDGFSVMNIANDKECEALVQEIKQVTGLLPSVEGVRKSDGLRQVVQGQFKELKAKLDAQVIDKPKRRISFEED